MLVGYLKLDLSLLTSGLGHQLLLLASIDCVWSVLSGHCVAMCISCMLHVISGHCVEMCISLHASCGVMCRSGSLKKVVYFVLEEMNVIILSYSFCGRPTILLN